MNKINLQLHSSTFLLGIFEIKIHKCGETMTDESKFEWHALS